MARTTNSDTLPYVDSRYELGMLATQRVRDLHGGATPVVERGNDKLTVTALREIASGKLDVPELRHEFVQSYKETPVVEETEEVESKSENPQLREFDAEINGEPMVEDVAIETEEDEMAALAEESEE